MFDLMIVREALKSSKTTDIQGDDHDSIISLLIHDIFGGEILKTPRKKGWHFYNRIDGMRVDFTNPKIDKASNEKRFQDIPSCPDETYSYFEHTEYATFLMRFVRAFEEAVGLDRYQPGYSA